MNRFKLYPFLCLFCLASFLAAEDHVSQSFRLTAEYDRPGLSVRHWVFRIQANGQTEYVPTYATPQAGMPETPVVRFTMSAGGMQRLQKLIADSKGMQPCETRTKGLARMGMKTFEYEGGGEVFKCSFNYTDNRSLAALSDFLMATSYTLEEGATIDRLHRYDRLGLDPVLIRLSTAAKDGKAPELLAIKPSLQALVSDDQVLERVRTKAAQLIALADHQ